MPFIYSETLIVRVKQPSTIGPCVTLLTLAAAVPQQYTKLIKTIFIPAPLFRNFF